MTDLAGEHHLQRRIERQLDERQLFAVVRFGRGVREVARQKQMIPALDRRGERVDSAQLLPFGRNEAGFLA